MNISILLKQLNKGLTHYFLPFNCILCSEETGRKLDLCIDCEEHLPWLKNICIYCAAPLSFKTESRCWTCLKKPLPFHKICIIFSYTQIIKKLITGLKFQKRLIYAHILGSLLAEKISLQYQKDNFPDLIIPVPLHKKRLYQRGFNQAMELARPISKRLNIPIDYKGCTRVHNTLAQSRLPANQRATNVKNAFAIQKYLSSKQHIALLDDVMTTGHTLIELSRALYYVGVKRIDVWCCARTYLDGT